MDFESLLHDISAITTASKRAAGRSLNRLLTQRNWLIGAYLVEYEQNGEDRAVYGANLLPRLAAALARAGEPRLGVSNLKNCRQVALTWPGLDIRQTMSGVLNFEPRILQTLSAVSSTPKRQTMSGEFTTDATGPETLLPAPSVDAAENQQLEWQDQAWVERLFSALSFSHLLELSRIDEPLKRAFYELHCLKEGWTVRELRRQRNSLLYERVGLSKDREAVLNLARQGELPDGPEAEIRDPYVLEFLGLKPRSSYTESGLEQALIDHLQEFLLELGRDFCFIARQFRVTIDNRHHYIDLLFFHRGLRSLVAIDLKVGDFEPAHAGQMSFYLNYLAENVARPDENPPIGILLCSAKNSAVVRYATAAIADSVFVSRYTLELPTEDDLARWLHDERAKLEN